MGLTGYIRSDCRVVDYRITSATEVF